MKITRQQLDEAARQGLIRPDQADALWPFLQQSGDDSASLRLTHILYYLGGLIAIGAMTLFMTLAWQRLGGWALTGLALGYAAVAVGLAERLQRRGTLPIPTGILAVLAVAMTPLAVYGAQTALGLWPDSPPRPGDLLPDLFTQNGRWLLMELATAVTGALALWRYRLPFLVMPMALTLWCLSQDAAPFITGSAASSWALNETVSLVFGIVLMLAAFALDVRTRRQPDFGFWLYLAGVTAFWLGLSLLTTDSDLGRFIYLLINVALILKAAVLSRRVFAVFGGLGVAAYLAWLAHSVFSDSLIFPLALSAIGLGVMVLGGLWQRHEARLAQHLRRLLPQRLQEVLTQD